jgi:hypothetical protein
VEFEGPDLSKLILDSAESVLGGGVGAAGRSSRRRLPGFSGRDSGAGLLSR